MSIWKLSVASKAAEIDYERNISRKYDDIWAIFVGYITAVYACDVLACTEARQLKFDRPNSRWSLLNPFHKSYILSTEGPQTAFSALTLLGGRKGIQPVKKLSGGVLARLSV